MSLFKEYLHDSAATEKSFDAEGWFDTGDRVRMDEEGNLFFADRNKDMLKVGGENVAASEIELLMIQSGLASEAAVIGKPHDMLDEVPVAFVIPNPGLGEDVAQKLIDLCAENLADFKVPRAVYIVEDLPRSLLNKISKKDLRDKLAEME
jgi:crotonobetaine/carnitine-CoA ligase